MWSTLFPAKIVKLNPPKKALKRATSTRLIKKQRFFSPAHLRFFLQNLLPNMRPVRITKRYAKPSTRTQQWKHAIATTMLIMACGSYGSAYGLGANATDSTRYTFDIPSLKVEQALSQLARQTGHQLLFSYAMVDSHNSTAVVGEHSLTSALQQLLQNTPLTGNLTERGVILVTDTRALHNLDEGRGNMNIKTKKSLLATFVAVFGAGAGSSGVMAQDGSDAATEQRQLEEVVVTAQKREQSVIDVPISIAVLGGEELALRGITDIEALGLAVPGLVVQDSGASQQRVFLRGIGNISGSSSPVGIYLDDTSLTGGVSEAQVDVRTYDLERVEVLRGPQGTLYGQGSMGGTIRFITKDPQLDRFGGRADIGTYFTEDGEPSYKLQGVVNVPLIENELGLRIAGTYNRDTGWMDQPAANKENINDQSLANVRVKALWQPTDALQVKAMAIIHRNDGSANNSEDENGNFTQTLNRTTSPVLDDDYEIYNLAVSYDFDSVRLLSVTNYLNLSKVRDNLGFIAAPRPLGPGPHLLFFDSFLNHSAKSQELRLSSVDEGPWFWTLGGYYESGHSPRNSNIDFGTPGPDTFVTLANIFRKPEYEQWAVYGDTNYALTDQLEVGVGLRYFEDDREFFDNTNTQTGTFDAFSPRFYVNYAVTDDIKTYASVTKGFRSGGFNAFGRDPYDPEELWTYELGTKMSLMEGRVDAEIALYYNDYTGYQITGVLPPPEPPFNVLSNAGNATILGIDFKFTWRATDQLRLGLTGNLNDGEFDEITIENSTYIEGDRLPFSPKYQVSLWADYRFNWQGTPGTFRLDYSQRGRTISRVRDISDFAGVTDVLNILNLRAEYELSDDMSVSVFANNLLNDRGIADSTVALFSRSRPRNVGIDFGIKF